MEIKAGDIVTVNGTVVCARDAEDGKHIIIKTNSGELCIREKDVNTIHPYKDHSLVDLRRGN